MKQLLTFIVSTSFIIVQAQEMKTFTDDLTKTHINYPSNWDFIENPATVFILMRPIEEQGQIFRENVNLIINESQGLTLAEYLKAAQKQLATQLPNYKELEVSYVEFGGKKYARIIYQHNSNNLPLQVAYYLLIHKKKVYNLTCSSVQDSFDKYLPLFQEMMISFTID
jgi:hypothetical protein